MPRVWRWDAAGNLILATFREVLPHFDSANRLIEHFSDAGLPVPNLFREILVGGGERSPLYAWIAETMRSVWPQLVEMGIVTEEAISAETLETRLRSGVVEARNQIECGPSLRMDENLTVIHVRTLERRGRVTGSVTA